MTASLLQAEKIDVVPLENGDCITGEIKKLEHSTDHISTIYIEGEHILYRTSRDGFEIKLSSG